MMSGNGEAKTWLTDGLVFEGDHHPSIRHMAPHFAFAGLSPPKQHAARQFANLAQYLVDSQEETPDLYQALTRLWEARNYAVQNVQDDKYTED